MSGEFNQIKETLVDKILDQGQRLRNAMVQSILQNDPLSSEVFLSKTHNTPMSSLSSLTTRTAADKKLLEAFINGDYLTKEQEELALETIRSLPASEVCETTEKTLSSRCSCPTCLSYHENNLKCHLRREHRVSTNCQNQKPECLPEFTNSNFTDCLREHRVSACQNTVAEVSNSNFTNILKQVDCLRVSLQSIHLNELGIKKVVQSSNKVNSYGASQSYFVEYTIPDIFFKQGEKLQSKVDSGLKSNHVSFCARGSSNVIHLKQSFTHTVRNLYSENLDNHDLIFHIKFKNSGQKKSESLGVARLNFGAFKESDSASCGKSLPIFLDEGLEIALGVLKVTVQLGAGKLYFGKEFVDAVLTSRTVREADIPVEEVLEEKVVDFDVKENLPLEPKQSSPRRPKSNFLQELSAQRKSRLKERLVEAERARLSEEDILFGFLYISEAQFLNFTPNSYILCQPFCQSDTSASKIVYNSSNPLYNFCQNIPLVYDETLLLNLRENFTLLEFWHTTGQAEELFGLTRIPLHQFYLGYRNSIILKHLKKNKLPIIGTDWWEPIYSPESKELIGQVQILTALGTEAQIKNLEEERGFRENIVKAKFPTVKPGNKRAEFGKLPDKNKFLIRPERSDKETQSKMEEDNKKPESQDMLASFLKLLEETRRPACVENGTNTEPTSSNEPRSSADQPEKRKTSDLVDSLQLALSLDNKEKTPHFRAQIVINGANQLPGRRKLKTKSKQRVKSKTCKRDETNVAPSTYVTFETLPNEPLQMTHVCSKSTSPQWGYSCEVNLPKDLLTNPQKRLIFKVWKKSTNAVLQPNLQTDLVLGFAALDLSVLACGLPNIRGWFNIVDFSGKCNGQINIHVNPLEKVQKPKQTTALPETSDCATSGIINSLIPDNAECNEVLSRALKRKFTELDEITQRLRLRLSEVVSEDSENSNDDIAEEFEQDINNLCIEEDFHLVDFEEEAKKFGQMLKAQQEIKESGNNGEENKEKNDDNVKSVGVGQSEGSMLLMSSNQEENVKEDSSGGASTDSSSTTKSFDRHLIEGKHRIDSLLEKLSLINAVESQQAPLSSRYISGCSTSTNEGVDGIFKDLDRSSRPNITATNRFESVDFQKLYGGSTSEENSSGTSVITNFSECRPNPLGQGTSEDKEP
ncbi:C2 domain-containing protein 3-like [Anthonomus grandis grandis]|uniref:C2 domain-containing protein 3-like n=1 Tax=Anthonomus grandis grandis TaxID=2921223 RepID=UPI00216524AC|nr:C2 domain-containing protein 3-like [Anthonomus grandis grandis]